MTFKVRVYIIDIMRRYQLRPFTLSPADTEVRNLEKRYLPSWPFWGAALWMVLAGLLGHCPSWLALVTVMALAVFLGLLADRRRRRIRRLERELRDMGQALEQEKADTLRREKELKAEQLKHEEQLRSAISHELRMPLSIIQGYTELLGRDDLEREQRQEYLDKILQRTKFINDTLVRHMLNSRERAMSSPDVQRLDLVALVQQITTDLSNVLANKGISIQYVSAREELWVKADGDLLGKIFYNLAENAAKYMGREGLIVIRLSCAGNQAQVIFQDDGMGLAEEETGRIFDLSFQGSNRKEGQGHGLYLVKRSIQAQGGDVSAFSRPGQGMTISFTLPLAETADS